MILGLAGLVLPIALVAQAFSVAAPGKDFEVYSEARLKRKAQ